MKMLHSPVRATGVPGRYRVQTANGDPFQCDARSFKDAAYRILHRVKHGGRVYVTDDEGKEVVFVRRLDRLVWLEASTD